MPKLRTATPQILEVTSAALIVAADPSRKSVTVTNTGGNPLMVGSFAAVTALTGLTLAPGESLTTSATAAIYGISTTGARAVFSETLL